MIERTGIVEELQARRERYGRFAYRAPQFVPAAPAKPVLPPLRMTPPPLTRLQQFDELVRKRAQERALKRKEKEDARLATDSEIIALALEFVAQLAIAGHAINGQPMTIDDLRGRPQGACWAKPRALVMALSRAIIPGVSLTQIGRFYRRDHTTAIAVCQRVSLWLGRFPALIAAARATCASRGVAEPSWLEAFQ